MTNKGDTHQFVLKEIKQNFYKIQQECSSTGRNTHYQSSGFKTPVMLMPPSWGHCQSLWMSLWEGVTCTLSRIQSFLSGHAALRHHGWFLPTCKESLSERFLSALMTRGISSSMPPIIKLQYVCAFKMRFKDFFYLAAGDNNNRSGREILLHVLARQAKKEGKI